MHMLLWHHSVRHQVTRERLFFWRLAVHLFNASAIAAALDDFLQSYPHPCRSYALYETFGMTDVLLRCWLPPGVSPEIFEADLLKALRDFSPDNPQYFEVYEVLRHDLWEDRGLPDPPSPDPVEARIDIAGIERHNAVVTEELRTRLDANDVLHAPPPAGVRPPGLDDAITRGYVAPLDLRRKGIRFNISFTHPRLSLNHAQRKDLNRRLLRICQQAVAAAEELDLESKPHVSLFGGYGTWSAFLITAQAADGHFYSFARDLVQRIFDDNIPDAFPGMRPVTTVYASRRIAFMRESLFSGPIRQFTEADLLTEAEDGTLEFKASAWLDARELYERNRYVRFDGGVEAVAKAVCGMLNRSGGVVVVGLAEVDRLPEKRDEQADLGRIQNLGIPVVPERNLAVFGIEEDLKLKSPRLSDFDEWRRNLVSSISSKIGPDPIGLLCVHIELLRLSEAYGGRSLGLVYVTPPQDRQTWFYYQDQFLVRHQGQTVPLHGARIDEYRRALLARTSDAL